MEWKSMACLLLGIALLPLELLLGLPSRPRRAFSVSELRLVRLRHRNAYMLRSEGRERSRSVR